MNQTIKNIYAVLLKYEGKVLGVYPHPDKLVVMTSRDKWGDDGKVHVTAHDAHIERHTIQCPTYTKK